VVSEATTGLETARGRVGLEDVRVRGKATSIGAACHCQPGIRDQCRTPAMHQFLERYLEWRSCREQSLKHRNSNLSDKKQSTIPAAVRQCHCADERMAAGI
jgi:hypothetical protein